MCRLPRDQGCHAVVNVDLKIKALHFNWIHQFLHGPDGKWKSLINYNLNKFQNLNLGVDLLNAKVNAGVKALPPFYSHILDTWFSFKGSRSSSPQTRGDVLAEPILFNRNILDRDTGPPLVSPFYVKYGLTRLTDIAYSVVPGLLPDAAVHELLGSNK